MKTDPPAGGAHSVSVLIVDDDPALLETYVAILEEKYRVVGASQPLEALRLVREQEFHVIVADWQMPLLDGLRLCQKVRAIDAAVACLLISGQMEDLASMVTPEERRLIGLLAKPFDPAELVHRIEQLARLSEIKRSLSRLKTSPIHAQADRPRRA